MLHRMLVHASLAEVHSALLAARVASVELTAPDRGVLHLADGLGLIHVAEGGVGIDIFDFSGTRHRVEVTQALGAAGFDVTNLES